MQQSNRQPESTIAESGPSFASTVLRIAADVERAETALLDRVAALLHANDSARAQRLLDMWKSQPAADVLRRDAADQLD